MDTAAQLKSDIEAFCEQHGMNASTFSKMATGDPAFWFKFSRGRVPKLDTYDKVRAFMRNYQPEKAA